MLLLLHLNSRSQIYCGTLYSRIFINLGCTFSSMFHVELNFVQSVKYMLRFTPLLSLLFLDLDNQFLASCIEKTIHLPLSCFCTFVKNQFTAFTWAFFWILSCFIDLCIYSFANTTLHWLLSSYSKSWKSGSVKPPIQSSISKSFCLSYSLCLSIKILKPDIWDLQKIMLHFYWDRIGSADQSWEKWHEMTLLSLSIQEHCVFLHLFVSFNFFHQCCCSFWHIDSQHISLDLYLNILGEGCYYKWCFKYWSPSWEEASQGNHIASTLGLPASRTEKQISVF